MIVALLVAIASAQAPSCEPLTEADLADRIHGSLDAIHRADVEGHRAIIRDLEQRLPCLDYVPSPERWAELLVGIAIVEHASGGDWQAPLITALRVDPDVHLLVGPTHPFRSWTPPGDAGVRERAVPDGVRIYLDGEVVQIVRDSAGIHLAQRRTGDGWTTLLLRGEPVPDAWFEEPVLATGGLRARAVVELRPGYARFGQAVDPAGTWLADQTDDRPAVGVGARASVGPAHLPGLYLDLRVPELPRARFALGHAGLDLAVGPLVVQAGGGVGWHEAVDGDGAVSDLVATPTVGLGLAPEAPAVDALVQAAWVPGFTRLGALAGFSPTQGAFRPRFGLDGSWTRAAWEQSGQDRDVHTSELCLAAVLGVGWRASR